MKTILILEPGSEDYDYHIPGAPCGPTTLCGWVDILYEEEYSRTVTCKACLEIVKYCKKLRIPKKETT